MKVRLVFQQALGHEKELVTSELRVPAANKSHEGHGDEAASVPVITRLVKGMPFTEAIPGPETWALPLLRPRFVR